MSDGPTTAGSIVGKLRLDKSQWDADKASAKADAAELASLDPTIKVDANVGEALGKLEAVRLAEDRLRNAVNAKVAAQITADAEAARLNSMLSGNAVNLGHVAEQTKVAEKATSEFKNSITDVDSALEHLNAVQQQYAESTNQVDEANKKSAASSGLALNRTMLIASAIAVLIPMLAPLAGFVVGVGGALAGMGAAGVLAIFGIKTAMEQGTAAGNQFATGIQGLKGDLAELAGTAAAGMLNSFNNAVGQLDAAMPGLNGQISVFAQMLGTTATVTLRGVLNAFQVLNPLFVQAGQYVEQLALGFEKWTSNGGLQSFTAMAMATFPQVAQALGALAMGALNLVQALMPLGTVVLAVLTGIGGLVSLLTTGLGSAFAPVVAGALAAWGAFKLFQMVTPWIEAVSVSLQALGISTELAAGPIGWIVAGISALVAVLGVVAVSQSNATQAANDYAVALQQDNDAIGQNVQALAAKKLHDDGAIASAHELGISTKTLTDAALGNADAQLKVAQVLEAVDKGLGTAGAATGNMTAEQNKQADALLKVKSGLKEQGDALKSASTLQKELADATAGATGASSSLAATYGMSVQNFDAATSAQKQNADQAAATTRQLQLENDAATLLTNAFALLNGTNLSVAQAQTGAAAATNTLADALKQNGLQIDGNSKAAVANQQAMQQKVAADQQSAEAISKQTGSTEAGTKAFAASKIALEQQLAAQGLLNPAIQAYIDKLYAIPPVVPTKIDMDAADALRRAQELKAWLDQLTSKTIVVTVQTNAVGAPAGAGPTNTVRKYADGGTVGGPGGPKSDSVAAWLSTGEEVTPNPQAGRYRATLKALASDNVAAARASLGGGSQSGSRPIYADGIGLIGTLVEVAGQQAQLVFNQGMQTAAMQMNGGLV